MTLQDFLSKEIKIIDNGENIKYQSLLFRQDEEGKHLYVNIGNGLQEVFSNGEDNVVEIVLK